jgi:hypothetical protein
VALKSGVGLFRLRTNSPMMRMSFFQISFVTVAGR